MENEEIIGLLSRIRTDSVLRTEFARILCSFVSQGALSSKESKRLLAEEIHEQRVSEELRQYLHRLVEIG